jgi:hypothetical protein
MIEANGSPDDEVRVAFPATQDFTRIGRVTAVGLALRQGIDVATVERLRGAVDQAVSALTGPGRIEAAARWAPDRFEIALTNTDTDIDAPDDLTERLAPLVDQVVVDGSRITLSILLTAD